MERDLKQWTLVILGRWNTAILSPDWLAKEIFRVESMAIYYPVLGGESPFFETNNIRVVVKEDRITFYPLKDNEAILQDIEDAAKRILDKLPYTPVDAFGENFHYIEEHSIYQFEEIFELSDEIKLLKDGVVSETSIKRTIDLGGCQLNLNIIAGPPYRVELNYHYKVDDAKQAERVMDRTYMTNRNNGLELLETVYGLTLSKEKSND